MLLRLQQFLDCQRGSPAVEFALLLPFMIILYLGILQISAAYQIKTRLAQVDLTLGDLIGRSEELNAAQIDDVFQAAELLMAPFSTANLTITIRALAIDGSGRGDVLWARRNDGEAASTDPVEQMQAGFGTDREIIEITTNFPFTLDLIFSEANAFAIGQTSYIVPRGADLGSWNGR